MRRNEHKEYDVIIIGAGFSGVFAAMEYSKAGKRVALVDKSEKIIPLTSSSHNECYKIHIGHHYFGDKETALNCLKGALEFAKKHSKYILGTGSEYASAPWRRGRNYLVSKSLYSVEAAKKICEDLKAYYTAYCKFNKTKPFGEPEEFIKYLKPEEYKSIVHKKIPFPNKKNLKEDMEVVFAVETGESQININEFTKSLANEIESDENITFFPNLEVASVSQNAGDFGFNLNIRGEERLGIEGKQSSEEIKGKQPPPPEEKYKSQIRGKTVLNCAWQNIENIDMRSGFYIEPGRREIRIKITILVELPPELHKMNTCIFSVGPFCSVTNVGEGMAIITYEPVTNAVKFDPTDWKAKNAAVKKYSGLTYKAKPNSDKEKLAKRTGDGILNGASKYIVGLEKAKIKELRVGYVKIFKEPGDNTDINLENSAIHKRRGDGIEVRDLGYTSVSGMKMTNAQANAKKAVVKTTQHTAIMETAKQFIQNIFTSQKFLNAKLPFDLKFSKKIYYNVLKNHWKSLFGFQKDTPDSGDNSSGKTNVKNHTKPNAEKQTVLLTEAIKAKNKVNIEILNNTPKLKKIPDASKNASWKKIENHWIHRGNKAYLEMREVGRNLKKVQKFEKNAYWRTEQSKAQSLPNEKRGEEISYRPKEDKKRPGPRPETARPGQRRKSTNYFHYHDGMGFWDKGVKGVKGIKIPFSKRNRSSTRKGRKYKRAKRTSSLIVRQPYSYSSSKPNPHFMYAGRRYSRLISHSVPKGYTYGRSNASHPTNTNISTTPSAKISYK